MDHLTARGWAAIGGAMAGLVACLAYSWPADVTHLWVVPALAVGAALAWAMGEKLGRRRRAWWRRAS